MGIVGEPAWQVVPRAGYQINSTAISAYGERCVLGTSDEFGDGDFAVFCYDDAGQLKWSDTIGTDMYQGVFWVAISHDACYAAAGGAIHKEGDQTGFLTAYRVDDGTRLLNERLNGRVNEVEISADGRLLAAVHEDQVQIYVRDDDDYFFLSDSKTLTGQFCISCGISSDGNRVVVGSYRDYDATEGPDGVVQAFDVLDGKLIALGEPSTQLGKVLRVAIVYDGSCWGASTHAGQCAVFSDENRGEAPVWTYQLPDRDLSVAYAFAIGKTDAGQVFTACGVNLGGDDAGHGCVFAVESVLTDDGYQPELLWSNDLNYDPNPGVNMDGECRYVTATDGQPYSSSQKRKPSGADKAQADESPGDFYLFNRKHGERIWQYPTSLMNWPMAISRDGNAIFGASDNGTAYYWK